MSEERVDPPIDRYVRVLKKRIAWSVATRRAIGLRDAREELWIEMVLRESADVARREDDGRSGVESREEFSWSEVETAFKRRVLTGAVINLDYIEPLRFLEDARDTVLRRVRDVMGRYRSVKVNTTFNGEFVSRDKTAVKTIATRNHPLLSTTDLREWYDTRVVGDIVASLKEFQERDSGWALSRILDLTVNVNVYNPMRAGCHVRVPREIQMKRAVVNVRSDDEACFAWSVVAALYPADKHRERSSRYPHYSEVLNLEGSKLPMTLNRIGRFERLNDISVNVYTVGERRRGKDGGDGGSGIRIVPLRLTDRKRERHVNLLYLSDATREGNAVGHFACIRDLSRLISSQLSKRQHRMHVCDRCMHYFRMSEKLSAHSEDCGKLNDCAIVLPGEDDRWLEFDHHSRKERIPFAVYADLECALEKEGDEGGRTKNTRIVQHHRVHSVAYYTRCSFDDAASAYGSYRGEDCVAWFVRELRDLALRAKAALDAVVPMTSDEREMFTNASRCYACERPFEAEDARVRDHCHLTGRFRGPAHSAYNLNYKDPYVIPVFFHNLSGYDAHFIIKDVANAYPGSVELLPVTKESYIAFSKTVRDTATEGDGENAARSRYVKLRFVDSFKFLGAGLDKLASYLDESKLTIARGEFRDLSDDDFRLLTRKGVFPYEYVDSVERLRETRLPPRESFYSSLTGDTVSESDYAHATRVWKRFSVENLGEYSDLYLKTDVLLLADVFENFRAACLESYGLDPAYYFTLPGYTWDAMLKYTGVRFELLTDIDMMMFVERGIRGGLSQCSNRYARANNKYMSAYDPSRPSIYLMYLDINNLYGWAMCQPLPYERFEWVDDLESLDVMSVPEDSTVGYILEVDLDYPADAHDAHADLPFCPTHDKPPGKRQSKLLATLYDKRRYVTHYRNLQQCVRHGLRLTRIHRALCFSQSPWLRGYMELNTRLRTNASNDFEKNLYKLMNNAVFGKTMENVRNRVDVRLATRWDGRFGAEALISKPNFHSRSVFSENLMAVELRKLEAKIDKPIYVGMSILDISKIRLYAFHYEYMSPLYGDKCKILYTDTDSLIYSVECEDAYERIKRDIDRFDTSDYAVDNPYGAPRAHKKVLGLMKDENNGALMLEFVGLRAKMYALRVKDRGDTKKSKGVRSSVVARTLTFNDYERCLRREIEMTREQSCLRSKLLRCTPCASRRSRSVRTTISVTSYRIRPTLCRGGTTGYLCEERRG
ncbi:uncharacterized protein LOC112638002 [Camponotus floridanus]|uniref:uncharacterized protein LOC112638002 n=1 Tax=Camponotus floridanus TaxID=104421 RepID=UPI000DC6B84B|nr:uncharacterized protein LOC112638002 [Camponotus floridanus]